MPDVRADTAQAQVQPHAHQHGFTHSLTHSSRLVSSRLVSSRLVSSRHVTSRTTHETERKVTVRSPLVDFASPHTAVSTATAFLCLRSVFPSRFPERNALASSLLDDLGSMLNGTGTDNAHRRSYSAVVCLHFLQSRWPRCDCVASGRLCNLVHYSCCFPSRTWCWRSMI